MNERIWDQYKVNWLKVEEWIGMAEDSELNFWFTAEQIARDLNFDAHEVETMLEAHFETHYIERRTGEHGYEYRRYMQAPASTHQPTIFLRVEAPPEKIFIVVDQLISDLRIQGWVCYGVNPKDYNDLDKRVSQVTVSFTTTRKGEQ